MCMMGFQLAKKRSEAQKEKKKEAKERELLSRKQRQLKDKQVSISSVGSGAPAVKDSSLAFECER